MNKEDNSSFSGPADNGQRRDEPVCSFVEETIAKQPATGTSVPGKYPGDGANSGNPDDAVNGMAGTSDSDPFDISSIILPPASETFRTKTVLQRINHGKPRAFDQVRVHPGLPMREGLSQVRRYIQLGIIKREDEATGKHYEFACSAAVTAAYEARRLVVRHTVYLAMHRSSRKPFLWTIKTPSSGMLHTSSETQLKIAEIAVDRWVGIEWDGITNILIEPDREAASAWNEPVWEIRSWEEAIRLAFPGNELIRDVNNPLILDMLGKAAR
jgi:hypothetical protein